MASGNVDIVRLLLEHGGDADLRISGYPFLLHMAVEAGHAAVADVLMDAGARIDAPPEPPRPREAPGTGASAGIHRMAERRKNCLQDKAVAAALAVQRVYRSYRAWKDERLREAARVRRLRRLERDLDDTDLADFSPTRSRTPSGIWPPQVARTRLRKTRRRPRRSCESHDTHIARARVLTSASCQTEAAGAV